MNKFCLNLAIKYKDQEDLENKNPKSSLETHESIILLLILLRPIIDLSKLDNFGRGTSINWFINFLKKVKDHSSQDSYFIKSFLYMKSADPSRRETISR